MYVSTTPWFSCYRPPNGVPTAHDLGGLPTPVREYHLAVMRGNEETAEFCLELWLSSL